MALILTLFVKLLHQELTLKSVKEIHFFSREGQLLKTLFDLYQKQMCFKGSLKINSHYLKVSRRSTFLPSLRKLEQEKFDVLFRQYRKITIADFLRSLNLEDVIEQLSEELAINMQILLEYMIYLIL